MRTVTGRALLDLVYPRRCAGCGRPATDSFRYLCWDCVAATAMIGPPFCSLCGDPVDGVVEHDFACSWCRRENPAFNAARSAARYRGVLRKILHQFKYDKATWLSRDLGGMLHACVNAHLSGIDFDAVTPVPLHTVRKRERSYNQAALLAGDLARRTGVPLAARALRRVRATGRQTELSASERQRNVHGAFGTRGDDWIRGRRMLLVDDIMTTGSTVNACARALVAAGAAGVWVVSVARG